MQRVFFSFAVRSPWCLVNEHEHFYTLRNIASNVDRRISGEIGLSIFLKSETLSYDDQG